MSETHFHGRVRGASGRLFWLGLAMILLGFVAVAFPMVSTLVAALIVGWTLLFAGAITFVGSFSIHGTGPFFGALLTGLVSFAAGLFAVLHPDAAAVALTLILGIIFLIQGAFEIFLAFELRPLQGWWGMLLSGFASAVLAILIAAGWPAISAIALGVLMGVNFLTTGLGYLAVSRALKN